MKGYISKYLIRMQLLLFFYPNKNLHFSFTCFWWICLLLHQAKAMQTSLTVNNLQVLASLNTFPWFYFFQPFAYFSIRNFAIQWTFVCHGCHVQKIARHKVKSATLSALSLTIFIDAVRIATHFIHTHSNVKIVTFFFLL